MVRYVRYRDEYWKTMAPLVTDDEGSVPDLRRVRFATGRTANFTMPL